MAETTRTTSQRVRVLKLIWWIPHYRASTFRRLSQNPHLDFCVCAGDDPTTHGGGRVTSANEIGTIDGINWRRLDSRRFRWPWLRNLEWQPEAVHIARKESFDVLICLGNRSVSNWLVRMICRWRGIPVIEWSHGVRGPERGFKWIMRRAYMKLAKAQLLYGSFARDFFARHGFSDEELFVVHNCLDHERQTAIRENITDEQIIATRKEFGASNENARLVFHSGRLDKRKNISLAIQAIKLLKEQGRNVTLVLIGDGREEAALRRLTETLNLTDDIHFYGPCYEEQTLGRIMSASDLCVSPGATGLIVMHSFVFGTPILTCENTSWIHGPEVEAITEGVTGRYFRESSAEDLADKMDNMLYPQPCKPSMKQACMKIIDESYTPEYQERVIVQALNYVLPANKQIPVPAVKT